MVMRARTGEDLKCLPAFLERLSLRVLAFLMFLFDWIAYIIGRALGCNQEVSHRNYANE